MKALAINGVYISCCHSAVFYDKQLARNLERPDIVVVPPGWVTGMRWRERTYHGIALDHFYYEMNKLDALFEKYLEQAKARVRV